MCNISTVNTDGQAHCGEAVNNATVLYSEEYFLICSRYIKMNSVRAGMAKYLFIDKVTKTPIY